MLVKIVLESMVVFIIQLLLMVVLKSMTLRFRKITHTRTGPALGRTKSVCTWCYTAQPFLNDKGASPHYLTSAAELFYLNHLRSCAATASGSHCTSSAVRAGTCKSALSVILEVLTAMCMVFCRNMLMLLNVLMDVVTGFFTGVL